MYTVFVETIKISIKFVENSTRLVSLVYKTMHHPIVIEHKKAKSTFGELKEISLGKKLKNVIIYG